MSTSERPDFDPVEGESDTGIVLKRDKFVGRKFQWLMIIPGLFFLLMALVAVVAGLASGAVAGSLVAGGVSAAFALAFGFMWATLSVVRTVLTNEALHVKVGLWGPKIALERIEACRVVQEQKRLSVGKRLENGEWISRFVLAPGEQVQVEYRDEDGGKRTLRFTASEPQELVRAVQRARGLRIATGDVETSDAAKTDTLAEAAREAQAEREAEAVAELEKDERSRS